jgi:hypothetical protein
VHPPIPDRVSVRIFEPVERIEGKQPSKYHFTIAGAAQLMQWVEIH